MTKCKIRFENDLKLLELCYVEKSLTQSLALMVKDILYFLLTKKVFTSVNNAIGLKLKICVSTNVVWKVKNVFICQAL